MQTRPGSEVPVNPVSRRRGSGAPLSRVTGTVVPWGRRTGQWLRWPRTMGVPGVAGYRSMYHRCSAGTAETRGRGVPPSPFPLIFPREKLGRGHCARKVVPQWVKVDRYFHLALFLLYCTLFLGKSDFCDRKPALGGQKTRIFCPRRSQFSSEKSQKCEKKSAIL